MKNIALISNVNNKIGEENYINRFTTTLPGQLDALNNKKYKNFVIVFIQQEQKILMKMNGGVI